MKNIRYVSIIVFFSIFTFCSSGSKSLNIDSKISDAIEFKLIDNNSDAVFYFSVGVTNDDSEKQAFIRSIKSISIYFIDKNNQIVDSALIPRLDISGVAESGTKSVSTVYGKANWKNIRKLDLSNFHFDFKLNTDIKTYSVTKKYSEIIKKQLGDNLEAMTLKPLIEHQSDTSAVFSILAKRNRMVDREYFPSSEMLRVAIYSVKGELLWNSDQKMDFLQVIKEVLPNQLGSEYKYSLLWNGKNNRNSALAPGKYVVKLTLPAIPKPYETKINLYLKQK